MPLPPEPSPSPSRLEGVIKGISERPGVYLMKDAEGRIIYIGKALNLHKRVSSYFQRPDALGAKTASLVAHVADIETVVTGSEKEALILESNLIKKHRPRYNVVLKDDKRYPSIRIDTKEAYPRVEIVRKTPDDGALYFGPYASAQAVRQTVKMINKTFPLRKCSNRTMGQRTRPCIHYQMGQCLAPCFRKVDPDVYGSVVKEVVLFLKGRTPELIRRVNRQMQRAAEREDFETAATLRDRMFALEKTLERQVTVTTDFLDRDVIGISGNSDFRIVTVMTVRRGFLQGVRHYELHHAEPEKGELVAQFLAQYYRQAHGIPVEVVVPELPENPSLLVDTLSEWKGRRVRIVCPQRGEKRQLLEMAQANSENTLRERLQNASRDAAVLDGIRLALHMDRLPTRIECFDNSNLSGSNPVSAMVTFVDGRPHKAGYRRYTLRSLAGSDDYASMAEVLSRRYGKVGAEDPLPDLMLVDGGKGQLNIAVAILERLGLSHAFMVAGIAKKDVRKGEAEDKIYLPNRANPVNFGRDGRLLLLLQQIRDEAHRFAIGFQRKRRGRVMIHSALDDIPGVGPRRKALLMKHFGSIKKIRAATESELSRLPGISSATASAIKKGLA